MKGNLYGMVVRPAVFISSEYHPQNEGHILSQKRRSEGHMNEYVNIDEWS